MIAIRQPLPKGSPSYFPFRFQETPFEVTAMILFIELTKFTISGQPVLTIEYLFLFYEGNFRLLFPG